MMSMMPSQKMGMETPTRESSMPPLSKMEFLWTADMTPTTIPSTEARMMATMASSTVAGNRDMISSTTGVLV